MKRLMQTSLIAGLLSISMVWAAAGLVQPQGGYGLQPVASADAPAEEGGLEAPASSPGLMREGIERPQRPQGRGLHAPPEAAPPSLAPGGGTDADPISNGGMGGSGRNSEP